MCARFEHRSPATSRLENAAPPKANASIAYTVLIALAFLLVMRGWLGPRPLNRDMTIYWSWADQFAGELARGTLYPRWLPLSDGGLGTPVFYFYPPIAFYVTAIFQVAGLSVYDSLIGCFLVAFAVSGIACWHWLREQSNHPLLGAMFFMAAPYHVYNYSDRAALAESVATAIIPILAIGLKRIADGRGGVVFTAIAYAALIGTHLPLALLASVFLIAPYAIAHSDRLARFAVAVAAGIGIAAIYLVPAFSLQSFRDVSQLHRTPNLQTVYWSIFSNHWSDLDFTVSFLVIGAVIIVASVPLILTRDRWAIHAMFVAILISGVVPFLWSLPLLRDVQFPFRALTLAEFSLATALGRLPRQISPVTFRWALPVFLSLLFLPGFHFEDQEVSSLRAKHADAYEYLPKGVMKPGQTTARLVDVLAARVPAPIVPGKIVEPHFYFPAWSCGGEEPRTQLLMHDRGCKPRIIWTAAEWIGSIVSAAAMALVLAFAAVSRSRSNIRSARRQRRRLAG